MREQIEQSKKTDGPLGIRIGVWLIVSGAVLACVFTISRSSRYTAQLSHDTASENLRMRNHSHETSSRRAGHIEFTPATYENGETWDFDEAQLSIRPDPLSPDAPSWWESRIQVGMTEDEVRSALGSRYREPRAMSGAELVAWAESRAIFVGNIHRDPDLLVAVRADTDYHVYSRQGTPTTANQMTIVFNRGTTSDWRVVYRAVRPRPCF